MEILTQKSYYAGIGSRKTPPNIGNKMKHIASILEKREYILRSGGASGADSYFESGVEDDSNKEIFLPRPGFNRNLSSFTRPTKEAFDLAREQFPGLDSRAPYIQEFVARNMHQILGQDLKTPSLCVICWTPEGKVCGGTRYGIILAKRNSIPVFNLATEEGMEFYTNLINS